MLNTIILLMLVGDELVGNEQSLGDDFVGGKVTINLFEVLSTAEFTAWQQFSIPQCAKKVVYDSPGLVDFAIGLISEFCF